jgi:hypothetical protein
MRQMTGRSVVAAFLSAVVIAVGGCAPSAGMLAPHYGAEGPSPVGFIVCHGYGCAHETRIALTPEEWRQARALFMLPPSDAADERGKVATAVVLLERAVSERTGTSAHQRRQTFNAGDATQVDCIDEAIDTWTYLRLLERDGMLRHHKVGEILHRANGLGLDAHNTAVLVARETAERFAVDPDLVDAGIPPPILPVAVWLGPWPPALALTDTMVPRP